MQLQQYDVIDKLYGKHIGKLKAKNLWDIYKAIEKTTGIPKADISKHYRIQRVGVA